jgi:hypothetical protein
MSKIVIVVRAGFVSDVFSDTALEVTIVDEDNARVGENYIDTYEISPLLEEQIEAYLSATKEIKA